MSASFNLSLDSFAKEVDLKTETVLKKVALETFTRIVQKTPVDTGRARGSWVISIERPGDSPENGADVNPTRELRKLSAIKADSVVYISNNLPYIEALENGHSKQAPAGMVEITLAEMRRFTNEF